MKDKILYIFLAIISIIILFLPFYLISPNNEAVDTSAVKKIDITKAYVSIGIPGGVLKKALSGDAKTFNPAMAQ